MAPDILGVMATQPRPATATYRTDLVTVLLSAWFTIGLMFDAWAHNNVPHLESFFTPWHAVFYSGFLATAAWIAWTVRDVRRLGRSAIPRGYEPAALAVVGFALFGIGDASWHTVFGIEQDINILFSPTHLGLAATMLVIITTPVRSAAGPGRMLPAVLATALATALVLLFFQYANAFTYAPEGVVYGMSTVNEEFTARLVAAIAVTSLVLLVPLLVLARRWRLPFGTATAVYAAAAALCAAITAGRSVPLLVGLVATGIGADLLARWLRPDPSTPVRYRLFGALVPLLTWTVYLAIAYGVAGSVHIIAPTGGHPERAVELYTGAPVLQALVGLLVALLLSPARAEQRPPRPAGIESPHYAKQLNDAARP
jgi:hypothetical protein